MTIRKKLAALACTALLMGTTAAAVHAAPSAATLTVDMFCEPNTATCEAYSAGGTGGNSFSWTGASVVTSGPDYSIAKITCTYSRGKTVKVTVKVTDSSGAIATAVDYYYCSY